MNYVSSAVNELHQDLLAEFLLYSYNRYKLLTDSWHSSNTRTFDGFNVRRLCPYLNIDLWGDDQAGAVAHDQVGSASIPEMVFLSSQSVRITT